MDEVKRLAILERYRKYQKCGLINPTRSEGELLVRRNAMLMAAMARYREKNK